MIAISTNGLEDYIWPAEAEFTPEMTTKAVKEALTEMLQSGTTTFNDMYNPNGVEIEKIYEAVKASKMRCYFSPTLFSSDMETTDETIAKTRCCHRDNQRLSGSQFQSYGGSSFALQL